MKKSCIQLVQFVFALAGMMSVTTAGAATLTFSTVPPVPGAKDIYNLSGASHDGANVSDGGTYADGGDNDAFTYVAGDRPSKGQTFTTGPDAGGYQVKAVWIRHCGYTNNTDLTWYQMATGSMMTIRVTDPSQVNTAGFELDSETYTVTGSEANKLPGGVSNSANGTGVWMRFQLDNPVTLQPNTTYGFDVTSLSDNLFFESFGTSNDVYSGGSAYQGSSNGATDDTLNPLVGDRVFMVEMVGQAVAPAVVTQPTNRMVLQGGSATFSVAASGTPPFSYQWYFNTNTLLGDQTNAVLTLAGVGTNMVGTYSVIVANDGGSVTSSVARLSVLLPYITTNLNFSAGGGGILDINSVGTAFDVRLGGTGSSLSSPDSNLYIDTGAGTLDITSTTCDYNGQLIMDQAEAIGINLSSLGFDGTQNFSVTCSFTNLPVGSYVNYDQVGGFVGASSTNFVRGGLIFNSDFENLSSYGVATPGANDAGIVTADAPPSEMIVTISRFDGNWNVSVNGQNVTPNTSLAFLNSCTNLTAGVFALNTSGVSSTAEVSRFKASLFAAPKLNISTGGGNLTLAWNVIGAVLESSTNLSDPNGWTPVSGAGASSYVISIPTSGSKFYRISQ
ncbi:MAG TPA: immunoglobulin domain-containing protein [Candidatus Binatia bacterium]|nr:immunoglobulin domain-containing protein [Candidatus Binatia bacterium]